MGRMTGSSFEGGYVYAWQKYPNNYAIENSGVDFGVIISFKTNATFNHDKGISDPKVQSFGLVVTKSRDQFSCVMCKLKEKQNEYQ